MPEMKTLCAVLLAALLLPLAAAAQEPPPCDGPFKMKLVDEETLARVLDSHKLWVESKERKGKRANLCGAILIKAKLNGAKLNGAKLNGAILINAKLIGAELSGADLSGAHLNWADLSKADLSGAKLSEAKLSFTVLAGAVFEPEGGKIPNLQDIMFALNMEEMAFFISPHALIELRDKFAKAGLEEQERKITYAIRHTKLEKLWDTNLLEWAFGYILFEKTAMWGLYPGDPLRILGWMILIFAFFYLVAIMKKTVDPMKEAGIFKDWHKERVRQDLGSAEPERLFQLGWWAIAFAVYFSVLSAFHIGWRDLNAGAWISRMQPREYSLRATGWVRLVSGIQSMISVYLIALWALTYFARPFG